MSKAQLHAKRRSLCYELGVVSRSFAEETYWIWHSRVGSKYSPISRVFHYRTFPSLKLASSSIPSNYNVTTRPTAFLNHKHKSYDFREYAMYFIKHYTAAHPQASALLLLQSNVSM